MTNNHQKNGSILQQSPATEEFIRTSVRTYPICKAYMTSIEDFKQTGEASIFVIRKHDNKYTSAMYFWTEYGKGFNNTIHFIDIDEKAQQALEKQFVEDEKAAEVLGKINSIKQNIKSKSTYDFLNEWL